MLKSLAALAQEIVAARDLARRCLAWMCSPGGGTHQETAVAVANWLGQSCEELLRLADAGEAAREETLRQLADCTEEMQAARAEVQAARAEVQAVRLELRQLIDLAASDADNGLVVEAVRRWCAHSPDAIIFRSAEGETVSASEMQHRLSAGDEAALAFVGAVVGAAVRQVGLPARRIAAWIERIVPLAPERDGEALRSRLLAAARDATTGDAQRTLLAAVNDLIWQLPASAKVPPTLAELRAELTGQEGSRRPLRPTGGAGDTSTPTRLRERLDAAIRACQRNSTIEAEPILAHLLAELDEPGSANLYAEVRAEEDRQIAKGRDDAHDDARERSREGEGWTACLTVLTRRLEGAREAIYLGEVQGEHPSALWRATWIKIACLALRAVKAHDRREARSA